MKTISITKNQNTYYEAQKGDATYVLEKGVSINSAELAGLVAYSSVEDRNILIKGTVNTASGYGVHVGSNEHDGGGRLDIAKSGNVYGSTAGVNLVADHQVFDNAGKIGGETAVKATGDDVLIENSGFITGKSCGIDIFSGTGTIRNDGMITGANQAISTLIMSGDSIKIVNNGTIGGAEYAIGLSNMDGARTVLVNHGEINAKYWAIQANFTDATEVIRNRGEISSQVWLGNGDDIFDGRGGKTYYVDGGGDDDLYVIDDPLIKLGEQSNSGIDTVRTSITWKLGANFENLVLTGKDSITGTGSDDANRIAGNAGQNTLFGLGGVDIINGGRGNDTLYGGAAADNFVFVTGTGHDVIADFQDGFDLVDLTGIKGVTDFAQIADAMVQNGTGVDIALGGGDMLTIDNVTISKLTAIDFAY